MPSSPRRRYGRIHPRRDARPARARTAAASGGAADTVLVTGGAGFIGSAVVRALLRDTAVRVVNLDKLTYAAAAAAAVAEGPRYVLERGDVCDAGRVRRLFARYRPRAVLHLAAETHVDRSIDAPGAFVRTNVVGTFTLLEEARRYWAALDGAGRAAFRFVQVSTDEVFGPLEADAPPCGAGAPYRPSSPYASSKAGADHLARAWHRTYGLPTIVTVCGNNYGPYQFPEKLIPLVLLNALEGKPLPLYGGGGQVRDWVYVDDHARALLAVLERGRAGEAYAIGGHGERRNLDVVRGVCRLLDELAPDPAGPRERLITPVADRPGHDARYALDCARTERELGWRPAVRFESGLRSTVRWYLENRAWWEPVRARYGGERLGLAGAAP